MNILITNDDGVFAKGINTLAAYLRQFANVTIVAPDRNCSGRSSALTIGKPIGVTPLEKQVYAVQGTPVDCVRLAIEKLLPSMPDLVISGINNCENLGCDVIYSGTVAAAIEAHFRGIPAIAVSLVGDQYFETAAQVIKNLILKAPELTIPEHALLNINVPDLPYHQLKSATVTRLGSRVHQNEIIEHTDPAGKTSFWSGPVGQAKDIAAETDFFAIMQRCVSITPLQIDMTDHHEKSAMHDWVTANMPIVAPELLDQAIT